jgi:hypothetical protein
VTARLLVTGSREFRDAQIVEGAILEAVRDFGRDLVVVHGDADGADALADEVAWRHGLEVDPRPADWDGLCRPSCKPGHRRTRRNGSTFCPAAGNYRNQAMVDLGAVVALAFLVPPDVSPCTGTRDCAWRAKDAGIPVRWYPKAVR